MADNRLDLIAELQDNASKKLDALSKKVEQYGKTVNKSGDSLDGMGKKTDSLVQRMSNMRSTMQDVGVVSTGSLTALGFALNGAVQKFNEADSSQRGFQATAKKLGVDMASLNGAVQSLTADGLLPVTTAQSALQNLMQAGLTDVSSMTKLMQNFKDEAIFGKSSTIDYATAVGNLAESFKTESSTLGNLSGITENYSMVLEKGAAALGKRVVDLTEAERAEAKMIGLLQVGAVSAGNAALAQDTLAGAQARATKASNELQIALGSALEPTLKKINDAITPIITIVTEWIQKNPELAANITIATTAILAMGVAVGGLSLLMTPAIVAFAKFIVVAGLVAAAIAGLRVAWDSDFLGMKTTIIEVASQISSTMGEIQNTLSIAFSEISLLYQEHKVTIDTIWNTFLSGLLVVITDTWNKITLVPKVAFDLILTGLRTFSKLFRGDWQGAFDEVYNLTVRILGNLKTALFDGFISMTKVVADGVASIISQFDWGKDALRLGGEFIDNIISGITNGIGRAVDVAKSAARSITNAFSGAMGSIGFSSGGIVPRFANGGIVEHFAKGGVSGTDTVPAMLTPGEVILNASQQKNLANHLRGGSGNTVNVYVDKVVGEEEYVERLANQIVKGLSLSTAF
jgi:hypothetical protein